MSPLAKPVEDLLALSASLFGMIDWGKRPDGEVQDFFARTRAARAALEADATPGDPAAVRAALERLVAESGEGVFEPGAGAWRQAVAALKQPDAPAVPRPAVVCLCGSTRFADAYRDANRTETLAGRIVLSVGLLGHSEGIDMGGPVKAALDELHLRKIDLADEVLVLNVGGYLGSSTLWEIEYARASGKPVRYLEPKEVPS